MCSGLFATRAAMVNTSLEAVHGVHMIINNVVMKAMTVNKVVTAAALIAFGAGVCCYTGRKPQCADMLSRY